MTERFAEGDLVFNERYGTGHVRMDAGANGDRPLRARARRVRTRQPATFVHALAGD